MEWLERRTELEHIRADIAASDLPIQTRRNLQRIVAVVQALNEQLGSHGNEEW